MAKSKQSGAAEGNSVTSERAVRLSRLVRLLGESGQTRDVLLRKLKLNIRGFYRDLETLRSAGIGISLMKGRYALEQELEEAFALLPFPDPGLTVGEARQLAKGRAAGNQKILRQLQRIDK